MIYQILIPPGQTNQTIYTNLNGNYRVKLISVYFVESLNNGDEVAIIQSNILNNVYNNRLYVGCQSVNMVNLEFNAQIQGNITFTVLDAGNLQALVLNNSSIIITLDINAL
jgi:hypothetical protein